MGNAQGTVRCEAKGSMADTNPTAFPEHVKQIALTQAMDKGNGYNKFTYEETTGPFPAGFDFANDLYLAQAGVEVPKVVPNEPNAPAHFSSKWEKLVAYHHGLYVPEMHQSTKTADDIRLAVDEFSAKVQKDAPKDACKYLQIEEFRCLSSHQYEKNPQGASKKCMKWWDEWQKCQWDQAKFNSGTTYIEGPQMRRRRAYIFYPDFKYA
eukprot:gnl/TRDRNA2_/TRDRNA2_179679_c0_seq1.p2 gnl/TRDRNA2_/TRDRNA2_179679_c0~~gnl/TRDRNA2_/TRDRNA2_179679_c0_seq1.p2  ORF type:complete len:209 (+),score=55.71 gnl/TRDRNA2_/TRDRNA2_179679_c0_seq1:89-715(+)